MMKRRCIMTHRFLVEDTVTIDKARYKELIIAEKALNAFYNARIGNWDGFKYAIEVLGESK